VFPGVDPRRSIEIVGVLPSATWGPNIIIPDRDYALEIIGAIMDAMQYFKKAIKNWLRLVCRGHHLGHNWGVLRVFRIGTGSRRMPASP